MPSAISLLGVPRGEDDRPQYLALRDQIASAIDLGKLSPGARLPSERQLQTDTGTARGTIREALFQLEAEGLIYRRDRSGWYVSPPPVTYDPTRWAGFMTYVVEQQRVPATETLSIESVAAPSAVADIFRRAPGTPMHCVTRRRSIDGRAVLIERIMVDPVLAPGLAEHDLNGSLTQILSTHYGLQAVRNRVDMRPCALTTSVAEMLGVKPGTPGLLVVRTSFAENGAVVEYDHEYWRHDAIRVHVDLQVRP
ncbi:UTRA domain-containing protein [Sphingomonas pokkalii]|uniref:GntR family transcriptional regulator n=1 Tax=Sphingomonas pokkalii TaxID=2175090 RepID=A0A2U0SGL8_9SPHN|nr:UTRA domain-containing protein [Sphingomonas pokkalii]PVX30518.1 GntR family transcriptional regulator [Sphingomonas pokkalii]